MIIHLLKTEGGKIIISIILGLGLATLFREVCENNNCIRFTGPIIENVENKIFKHDEKCFKYEYITTKCNPYKKNIEIE